MEIRESAFRLTAEDCAVKANTNRVRFNYFVDIAQKHVLKTIFKQPKGLRPAAINIEAHR